MLRIFHLFLVSRAYLYTTCSIDKKLSWVVGHLPQMDANHHVGGTVYLLIKKFMMLAWSNIEILVQVASCSKESSPTISTQFSCGGGDETMEERSKWWWRRAGEIVELHPLQYLHHTETWREKESKFHSDTAPTPRYAFFSLLGALSLGLPSHAPKRRTETVFDVWLNAELSTSFGTLCSISGSL